MRLFWKEEGSEGDPPDQGGLQRDGEPVQRVHDARDGVHSTAVPEQGALFERPRRQGTLCQQGEPPRDQPVPVEQASCYWGWRKGRPP